MNPSDQSEEIDFPANHNGSGSEESLTFNTQSADPVADLPKEKKTRQRKAAATEPGIPAKVAAELMQHFDLAVYLSYFPAVTEAGHAYLSAAIKSPSRNPTGARSNTTRYASLKTHLTATAESDRAEMPALVMADHTDDVLYAVEQPPSFGISYPSGRSTASPLATPDLVLFTLNGPQICECKMNADVARKCVVQPGRYQHNDDTTFRSDPASTATKELGMPYRILTEANYEGLFLRALIFLTPYFRSKLRRSVTDEERESILAAVSAEPGITASKLPISDASRRADLVYTMLAHRELFAPLSETNILALDKLRLFRTPVQEKAYALFCGTVKRELEYATPVARQLPPGAEFRIHRVTFTVISHRTKGVWVRNGRSGLEMEISYLLLQQTEVYLQLREEDMTARDLIVALSEERLAQYLKNRRLIQPYLPFGKLAGQSPKNRQTRRLLQAYRAANLNSGGGDRALIPYVHKGCTKLRKSETSDNLLKATIQDEYLRTGSVSAIAVYRTYLTSADKLKLPSADRYSSRSVFRHVADLNEYLCALKRQGKRAALKFRQPSWSKSLIGPPNGLAPYSIGHIDHTLCDVLVFNSVTAEYDRPWISALVDGYDGRILAAVIWFGSPSTTTVFDVLQDCLQRHGVLPIKIRCDWGAEFRSVAVQVALASLGIHVSYRAKGEPRAGSPVETSFRGLNERGFHLMDGSTVILQNPREATKAVQPLNFARWRRPEFDSLVEKYITANNRAPKEHKLSPEEILSTFVANHGVHGGSWLPPELIERLQHLPEKNTRIVSKKATIRVRTADYAAPELTDLIGEEVRVFCDHKDPRVVWFDHPKTRLRIRCQSVTSEILHADSAAEAEERINRRITGSYRRVQDAHAIWAEFQADLRAIEAQLKEEAPKLSEQAAKPSESSTSVAAETLNYDSIPTAKLKTD